LAWIEAAGRAVAADAEPKTHSQLCPIWVQRAKKPPITDCDCWILHKAIANAVLAIAAAAPLIAAAERRATADQIKAAVAETEADIDAMRDRAKAHHYKAALGRALSRVRTLGDQVEEIARRVGATPHGSTPPPAEGASDG
jgi:hypothetical protein